MKPKIIIFTKASLSERDRLIKESCFEAFKEEYLATRLTMELTQHAILSAPVPLAEVFELPDVESVNLRLEIWDTPIEYDQGYKDCFKFIMDLIKDKVK